VYHGFEAFDHTAGFGTRIYLDVIVKGRGV
jgi:hypothetical protein